MRICIAPANIKKDKKVGMHFQKEGIDRLFRRTWYSVKEKDIFHLFSDSRAHHSTPIREPISASDNLWFSNNAVQRYFIDWRCLGKGKGNSITKFRRGYRIKTS